jgi:hypothetical protein
MALTGGKMNKLMALLLTAILIVGVSVAENLDLGWNVMKNNTTGTSFAGTDCTYCWVAPAGTLKSRVMFVGGLHYVSEDSFTVMIDIDTCGRYGHANHDSVDCAIEIWQGHNSSCADWKIAAYSQDAGTEVDTVFKFKPFLPFWQVWYINAQANDTMCVDTSGVFIKAE